MLSSSTTHKECSHKVLFSSLKYLSGNKLFSMRRRPRALARDTKRPACLPFSKRARSPFVRPSAEWDPSLERAFLLLLFTLSFVVQRRAYSRKRLPTTQGRRTAAPARCPRRRLIWSHRHSEIWIARNHQLAWHKLCHLCRLPQRRLGDCVWAEDSDAAAERVLRDPESR